jgi:hypothetical protein
MYDLEANPEETDNLGSPANPRYNDPAIKAERERLAQKLKETEARIVKKHQNVTADPMSGGHVAGGHVQPG